MALSNKEKNKIKKLKKNARLIFKNQKIIVSQAKDLISEANKDLKKISEKHIYPKIEPKISNSIETILKAKKNVKNASLPIFYRIINLLIRKLDNLEENNKLSLQLKKIEIKNNLIKYKKKKPILKYIILLLSSIIISFITYIVWDSIKPDDELWLMPDEKNNNG